MNSAIDNPLIFIDTGEVILGGNFHGEYPAKVYRSFFNVFIIEDFVQGFRLFGNWCT
jgi:hypothetical protein